MNKGLRDWLRMKCIGIDQPQSRTGNYKAIYQQNSHTIRITSIYLQLSVNMNSNQQLAPTQSLYLKQFFTNYFERKQHTQAISALTNGLTVINSLISHFQQPTHHQTQKYHSGGREEQDMSQMVQDIYNRLSHIFETIKQERETESDSLFSSRKQNTFENNIQDEELYEILNKYKTDFKKQKEERIRLQKEIDSLKDKIHSLKIQKDRTAEKASSSEKAVQRLKNENRHLQTTISSLKQQIQELQHYKQQAEIKMEESLQLQQSHNNLTKEYELLLLKYDQSQQQQVLLKEKFKHLDAIVESKIQQNQTKWTKTIETKLNTTQIYQKPACRAFRDFIKSFNKENIVNNN